MTSNLQAASLRKGAQIHSLETSVPNKTISTQYIMALSPHKLLWKCIQTSLFHLEEALYKLDSYSCKLFACKTMI